MIRPKRRRRTMVHETCPAIGGLAIACKLPRGHDGKHQSIHGMTWYEVGK